MSASHARVEGRRYCSKAKHDKPHPDPCGGPGEAPPQCCTSGGSGGGGSAGLGRDYRMTVDPIASAHRGQEMLRAVESKGQHRAQSEHTGTALYKWCAHAGVLKGMGEGGGGTAGPRGSAGVRPVVCASERPRTRGLRGTEEGIPHPPTRPTRRCALPTCGAPIAGRDGPRRRQYGPERALVAKRAPGDRPAPKTSDRLARSRKGALTRCTRCASPMLTTAAFAARCCCTARHTCVGTALQPASSGCSGCALCAQGCVLHRPGRAM